MIRVTVELISFGNEDKKETLKVLNIVNHKKAKTGKTCSYVYELINYDPIGEGLYNMYVEDEGMVKRHHRERGILTLLKMVFKQIKDK